MGKGIVPEGHYERIELYAERYALGQDIFTGRSLGKIEYEQREEAELRKARSASYGFGHVNGFNKHVNDEVSS
jgi:hypothetical protein